MGLFATALVAAPGLPAVQRLLRLTHVDRELEKLSGCYLGADVRRKDRAVDLVAAGSEVPVLGTRPAKDILGTHSV